MADLDRGVSTVVGYVLNLGVATLLISGLLIAGSGLVTDQRERTARTELDVIGNRIAADLETADRLAETGTVRLDAELPETVAGSSYRVAIDTTGGTVTVRLATADPAIERSVTVRNDSPVQSGAVGGGPIRIVGTNGTLEVRDG